MSLILDKEVYEWLSSLDLVNVNQVSQQLPSGKVALEDYVANLFLNGTIISRLLEKIVEYYPKIADKSVLNHAHLDNLKVASTPSSKLYNWNVLCDALKKMNIEIDQDVKSLIVAGDTDMINEVLGEIYAKISKIPNDIQKQSKTKFEKLDRSIEISPELMKSPMLGSSLSNSGLRLKNNSREVIDLNKMDVDKELSQTQTLLEFFLVSVARSMGLNAKQAVQVLSNNHKYLAHIVVKGIKEVFEPIINWFRELSANISQLVYLIAQEEDKKHTMVFVHHGLKAGLVSKDFEVAQIACSFFQQLSYEYLNQDLLSYAWEWFVSDQGGLQYTLMCIKRHPEIAESAIRVIIEFSRYNLMELFTHHLRRFHPDTREYLSTIRSLLRPLSDNALTRGEIGNSGVIDVWIDFALKVIDSEDEGDRSADIRISALSLICDVWIAYPAKIEENEVFPNKIVMILKRSSRSMNKNIKITSLALLFRLLDQFASEKDMYAPVIYKTLTFCLIENYNYPQIREFILQNFKSLFKVGENIPIGIIIEPLMKQLQVTDTSTMSFNTFDMEFLESAARHPKLGLKHAIQLLDVFAKLYLNNIIFASVSGKVLLHIVASNIDSEPIQEYVLKFIKIALAILFTSEKSKRPKEKILPKYNNKNASSKPVISNVELEQEVLNAQRRALIIEMIKKLINLNNDIINNRARTLLLYTNHQLTETLKSEQKGIMMLISLYGDPQEIIENFEQELIKEELLIQSPTSPQKQMLSPELPNDEGKSKESTQKSELEGTEFFKEMGIGPKKRKMKLDKAQTTELAYLRKPKADPKILNGLVEIRKSYTEKNLREKEKEDEEKEKFLHTKKKLKTIIDKRMIELGVAFLGNKHIVSDIVFEEGSREAERVIEKRSGLPEISIVHLENEEDRDKEGVQVILRKYTKVLKNFYYSYANSGFSNKDASTFNRMEEKLRLISLPEIWKIIKEYDIDHLISYDEFTALVRLVNTEIIKDYNLKWLDFEGFQQFIIQLAVFIYSRPPKDLSHLPIFCHLSQLMLQCRDAAIKRGKSTVLFDDPDSTNAGDRELNRHLNEILKKDPKYPVPEAYKKIQEKEIQFSYEFNPAVKVGGNYRIAYELIDEILFNALQIRLVEPITSFTYTAKAKLRLVTPVNTKLYQVEPFVQRSPEEKAREQFARFNTEAMTSPKKNRTLVVEPVVNLSIVLKEEIFKQPAKQRHIYREVAIVLQDICEAVAQGKDKIRDPDAPVANRVIEERAKVKSQELKEKEEAHKRRLEHSKHLKEKVKTLAELKRDELKKKQEEMLLKGAEPDKRELEWKRYHDDQKNKIKEHKDKINEEKIAAEEKEKEKKWRELEIKKKRFQEFNSKKVAELYKQIDKVKENQGEKDRVKKEQEDRKSKVEKDQKSRRLQELKKELDDFEIQKKNDDDIHNLVQKKEIRDIFRRYEKPLKQVYSWYCLSTHHAIGNLDQLDSLLYDPYMTFAKDFSFFPTILPPREIRVIFKSLTKVKPIVERRQVSLTFEDFEETLLRIAIKGGEIFNQIFASRANRGSQLGDQAYEKMVNNHNKAEEEALEAESPGLTDIYNRIDETTKNTMQGLFYYLDLPNDKQALYDKLHELRSRVIPFHEKKQAWKQILQSTTDQIQAVETDQPERKEETQKHNQQEQEEET